VGVTVFDKAGRITTKLTGAAMGAAAAAEKGVADAAHGAAGHQVGGRRALENDMRSHRMGKGGDDDERGAMGVGGSDDDDDGDDMGSGSGSGSEGEEGGEGGGRRGSVIDLEGKVKEEDALDVVERTTACYVLSSANMTRWWLGELVDHPRWDQVVMTLIAISTVLTYLLTCLLACLLTSAFSFFYLLNDSLRYSFPHYPLLYCRCCSRSTHPCSIPPAAWQRS